MNWNPNPIKFKVYGKTYSTPNWKIVDVELAISPGHSPHPELVWVQETGKPDINGTMICDGNIITFLDETLPFAKYLVNWDSDCFSWAVDGFGGPNLLLDHVEHDIKIVGHYLNDKDMLEKAVEDEKKWRLKNDQH